MERSEWSLCATSAKNEGDEVPLPDGRPTASEVSTGHPPGTIGTVGTTNPYAINPHVVHRTREAVAGLSRRGRRKALARAAEVTYLAILDADSGVSTQDRIRAADGAARVSGLVKDGTASRVSLVVTFKGLRRDVVDAEAIEARIVEAAGLPPLAGNGATGGVQGGGGEGG